MPATDNIVLDFEAVETNGRAHLMGDIFTVPLGMKLLIRIRGTDTITRLEIIRNNEILYTAPGQEKKKWLLSTSTKLRSRARTGITSA